MQLVSRSLGGTSSGSQQRPFVDNGHRFSRSRGHYVAARQQHLTSLHSVQDAPSAPSAPAGLAGAGSVDLTCNRSGEWPQTTRRNTLLLLTGSAAALTVRPDAARADDFVTLPSGLKMLTIREGEGATPQPGDIVVVHWAGFTQGYQGKRIDNTSIRDEPYEFKLGAGQAIPAFELAVQNMRVGGIARVEVPGELPALGYPLDRGERFTGELISPDLKIYKYRYGPQPSELGGQRALDFVLDNPTLRDFNRTLLLDIKLLAVRRTSNK